MFQNIQNENIQYQEDIEENNDKIKTIIRNLFKKQNVILYIISFMISTVGFGKDVNPFAISFLAAICSNDIPIGIIYILSLLGTGIGFGKEGILTYLLTSLVFLVMMSIFKIKIDDINENKKLGIRLCIATAITQIGKLFFRQVLVYDILVSIIYIISAVIFYKVFKSAVKVVKDTETKKVFAVEEIIATSLLIAIAVAGFKDVTIWSYSLKNILSILIVLILGWQNGMLVGGTAGITIGLVLGIIGGGDVIQIASYAISGMIAGLLNKLGKIGVIVGFVLGNAFLTYISNGDTTSIIKFQEILIASIGLLVMPKNTKISIEEMFKKDAYLPVTGENRLEKHEDAIYKLNNVSEVITEVAKSYKEVAATVVEKEELEEKKYNIFKQELEKNIESLEDNILYDNFFEEDDIYLSIWNKINENEFLSKDNLIKILEENNNYIIESDDYETNRRVENDINNILRAVNSAYRVYKLNNIYNIKMKNSKQNMGNQLEGISKAISSIVDNLSEENKKDENELEEEEIRELLKKKEIDVSQVKIKRNARTEIDIYTGICKANKIEECKCEKIEKILNKKYEEKLKLVNENCALTTGSDMCKLKYVSEDKYNLQIGIAKATKWDSPVSGDSNLNVGLEDGKKLIAISDGMGSGPKARQSSTIAVKLLKRLLLSGFDKETSLELVNSNICLNSRDETYATLDMAIFDLYKGNVEFVKNGACPTYIKNRKNVDIIKTISIPTGILENIDLEVFDRDIEDGDILVMCSDGIIESNTEYENKELWLKYLLENIETENAQKIADLILQESVDNCVGKAKDDMTVMVMKINKN